MTAAELLAGLEKRGLRARLVSIERLEDTRERIESLHRQGQFDNEFYDERLARFEFRPPAELPGARSIVVVAVPQPQYRLVFHWRGHEIPARVPPTYLFWQATNKLVLDAVNGLLAPHGLRAAAASLPIKTLVVHSGLGRYGRNNLTYVDGLGSFHRPVAVCTDLPAEDAGWQEPRMLDACERCSACRRACPTGAIGEDRFLLHAERCLTFLNEKPGDKPFPDWVRSPGHECLVGCMYCQRVCPENRPFRDKVQPGPEFSEEETVLLLEGTALDRMPIGLRKKLEAHDLVEYLDTMPRNLGAIIHRARRQPKPKEAR